MGCSYCHGGALTLDECYFEPVSSCSLNDVYGPDVVSAWGNNLDEGALNEARKKLHGDRIHFSAVTGKTEFGKIPPQVCLTYGTCLLKHALASLRWLYYTWILGQ